MRYMTALAVLLGLLFLTTPAEPFDKYNNATVGRLVGSSTITGAQQAPDWNSLLNKPTIPVACVDIYDGAQGIQGVAGVDGVIGIDGLPGADGIDGTNGADGLPGAQGEQGPPGSSANVTQAAIAGLLDDPTDGVTIWLQQGATEAGTSAKFGIKDTPGNSKHWVDANGTTFRQCIAGDTAAAFTMLSPSGVVIYSVSCDNKMNFKGAVTIQ